MAFFSADNGCSRKTLLNLNHNSFLNFLFSAPGWFSSGSCQDAFNQGIPLSRQLLSDYSSPSKH